MNTATSKQKLVEHKRKVLEVLDCTQKVIDYVSEKIKAFCPTGEDGGVDNSCSPEDGGSSQVEYTESGIPSISKSDRVGFITGLFKDEKWGSQLPKGIVKKSQVKEFLENGDVEKFAESMNHLASASFQETGIKFKDRMTYASLGLRAKTEYANRYGGFEIAKSSILSNVHAKTLQASANLEKTQIESIAEYTARYEDINTNLRKGKNLTKKQKKTVDAINKLVDSVGDWDKPAEIYRGIMTHSTKEHKSILGKIKDAMKSGKEWKDEAIMSTSASRKMSEDWMTEGGQNGILLKINAKRGATISSFTGLGFQEEIIQKPGSRYNIKGVSTEKNHRGEKITVVSLDQI